MKGLSWIGLGFLVVLACSTPVLAGPNAQGMLWVHTMLNPQQSDNNYAGFSTHDCDPLGQDTSLDPTTTIPANQDVVWWVFAAFPQSASPRVAVVTFGISYDPNVVSISSSGRGPDWSGELPTTGPDQPAWPQEDGSGVALNVDPPLTCVLKELYWFKGQTTGPATFRLQGHPGQGGSFFDDDIPASNDVITAYGYLGMGGTAGLNPQPVPVRETSWGWIKNAYR